MTPSVYQRSDMLRPFPADGDVTLISAVRPERSAAALDDRADHTSQRHLVVRRSREAVPRHGLQPLHRRRRTTTDAQLVAVALAHVGLAVHLDLAFSHESRRSREPPPYPSPPPSSASRRS